MEKTEQTHVSRTPRTNQSRVCNVCGGRFTAPVQGDHRRHNCRSITGHVLGELPAECWQRVEHPFASDLLAAVPAYLQSRKVSDVRHSVRLVIATQVLDLSREGAISADQVNDLLRRHPRQAVRHFAERLPERSALRAQIMDALERIRQQEAASTDQGCINIVRPVVILPDDLNHGVTLFAEKSQRIAEIKHRHGHRYSERTVRKRAHDARAFCEFLASKGLQHWPEVAQHHLDEYIAVTNRAAAARVYTFLQFIRQNFRLTQRFIRPKLRPKPPVDAVMPIEEIPPVLRRLLDSSDQQAIVGGLFLALFAQTPTRSAELTYGNFRKRNGKIEALFAEQWTPLDPLTTKHLQKLIPDIGATENDRRTTRIFQSNAASLGYKVVRTAGVPLRPLRLGAVANLIRSGITDRGALHRILGVSMPTLAYVEKIFEWDLHMTVDPAMVESRNEVIRGERTE